MADDFDEHDELYTLRLQARPLGLWVGMHHRYSPALGGGPFFVMPKKTQQKQRNPTLLKYATAQQVEDFLNEQAGAYAE